MTELSNQELYELIRTGDQSARDRLIEASEPFIKWCVVRELGSRRSSRTLREEMMGAGTLALVEVCESFKHREVEDVDKVIIAEIRRAMRDEIRNQPLIVAPKRSERRAAKQGQILKVPTKLATAEIDSDRAVHSPTVDGEIWEEIMACCAKPKELEFVELLDAGASTEAIAESMDMTPRNVNHLRASVRDRYKERNDALAA